MRRPGAAAVGELAAWWTVLIALYLVFISTVTVLEFAVGAAGAALAAVAARAVRIASAGGTGPGGRWAAALLSWPGAVLTDTVRLAAATAGCLRGGADPCRFRTLRLKPGTGAAWAGAVLSGTPGAYVVRVTPARPGDETSGDRLTVHVMSAERTALERALTVGDRA